MVVGRLLQESVVPHARNLPSAPCNNAAMDYFKANAAKRASNANISQYFAVFAEFALKELVEDTQWTQICRFPNIALFHVHVFLHHL